MVTDLDESKTLDELEFFFTPMLVQVSQLPLGMMNSDTAEAIGDEIGEFMDVDTDDGRKAVGRFLRIKVRIDIRKPLMRGVMVIVDSIGSERWCPMAYEHLPDFCYICGLMGHIDKLCDVEWVRGKPLPYDRSLRVFPPKKKGSSEFGGKGGSNSMLPWHTNSGGSGSRGSLSDSFRKSKEGLRSEAPNWRKNISGSVEEGKGGLAVGEEKEVTSPLKILDKASLALAEKEKDARKKLFPALSGKEKVNSAILDVNRGMQKEVHSEELIPADATKLNEKKKWKRAKLGEEEKKGGGLAKGSGTLNSSPSLVEKKRGREEEMMDATEPNDDGPKRARKGDEEMFEVVTSKNEEAGPADWSCESS